MANELAEGWLPAPCSIVVVFGGHHDGLLPSKTELATLLGGTIRDVPGGPQYLVKQAYTATNLMGARVEWVNDDVRPRTRLQIRHEIGSEDVFPELAKVMRKLLPGSGGPKPQMTGINFARIYIDSQRFDVASSLRKIADAHAGSLIGGRNTRAIQMTLASVKEGTDVQLKLASAEAQLPITGRAQALQAEVNFSIETTTLTAVRRQAGLETLTHWFADFEKMMQRVERTLARVH